jgi:primosomal protein N' (replication factor Y)
MKLVSVIPIAKGVFNENLSYFTSKKVLAGDLVSIPFGRRTVPALVVSSNEIKDAKTKIKQADFKLKPIKEILSGNFLEKEFIAACEDISKYFVSPLGAVIKDLVPQVILDSPTNTKSKSTPKDNAGHTEIISFQGKEQERFQYYRSIIREEFAKNNSVFFCLPSILDIEKFTSALQKGIENYVIPLHSKIPKKKIKKLWEEVVEGVHPLVIIATKSFLSIPQKNIRTLVMENENSSFHKSQVRPYIDTRKIAEILAVKKKMKLIFGDSVVRTETYYKLGEPPVARILSEAKQTITDLSLKKDGWQKSQTFSAISDELKKILQTAHSNNENSVLYVGRRGHSPVTVCRDCFRAILCEKCDTPLVLHKNNLSKKTKFICHKCLEETSSSGRCPYCNSWRIESSGIGIQKIEEELKKVLPLSKIFRIDSDLIKKQKDGIEIIEKFLNSPGAILIGTEILFSYLNTPVENTAIISIDGLFSLPDFRLNEKIFRLLLNLRALAKKTFLIQTRLPEQKVFKYAMEGNISRFYREELESRKQFKYPPFKTLIKLSKGSKNLSALKTETRALAKKLDKWNSVSYPAFIPKIKNIHQHHILLKIEQATYPKQQTDLWNILSSIPPTWKINVDPESLL